MQVLIAIHMLVNAISVSIPVLCNIFVAGRLPNPAMIRIQVKAACSYGFVVFHNVSLVSRLLRGSFTVCADLLNLTYDAMPQDFVTLVVTEFGAIPPTSVPVILREYRQEPTI